jgi:hypothetical protein
MKKHTFLFYSFLLLSVFTLQAQKQFDGEIRFEVRMEGTDDPNLLASMESFTQTEIVLGNKSKTIIKPNEMVAITQIWDGDKGTSFSIIEITGIGKYYKKWNAEQHKEKMKLTEYSFIYENDFKTICDYKCQKVLAVATNLEDDTQTESTLYVTKEIGGSKINGGQFVGLEGFPMMAIQTMPEYCEECVLVMQAIKITPKKIKDVDFLLPDDAKNIDDDPEMKEMLKGAFGDE